MSGPAPRVRTCLGCHGVFRCGNFRRHVSNDCGEMISVRELREAIQEVADRDGDDSITFVALGMAIERIAASRMSSIGAGLLEDDDMDVDFHGTRTTVRSLELASRTRAQRRRERRAERGVNSLADEVSNLHI